MTSPDKALRSLLVLIAFGMVAIGALQIGLEFTRHRLKGTEFDVLNCLLWSLPVALGVVLMAFSGRLARKFLDEDGDDDLPS
jgi:hypothetical protein